MNEARRRRIRKVIKAVSSPNQDWDAIQMELSDLLDEETEAMENIPESLQESDRYYICEESVDYLETALSAADVDIDDPESCLEAIDEIVDALSQIDGV